MPTTTRYRPAAISSHVRYPRSAVAAQEQGHLGAEGLEDRRGRGRERVRLRDDEDRPPPPRERLPHARHGEALLVLRGRAQHERAGAAPQRVDQAPGVHVRRERTGRGPRGDGSPGGGGDRGPGASAGGRGSGARPARVGPTERLLLRGDTGRDHGAQHGGEGSHVALRDPAGEREPTLVEEADGREHPTHGQDALRHLPGRSEHPPPDQAPVEPDLHEGAHAGPERGVELVGEGTVEREDRPVDADGDGALQDGRARRRPGGAHPRGPRPSQVNSGSCGRSGRRRRSSCRSGRRRSRCSMIAAAAVERLAHQLGDPLGSTCLGPEGVHHDRDRVAPTPMA
ncbi:MAG: hypothetical protein KatS3mg014_1294 [Actinomycetota bacterium]|nr:MAG: hypothetical protein KatS3mg014_1294 [Actinomycetota bacterium]